MLSGSDNLGGIGPGEYSSLNYGVKNDSTAPAYVFVKVEIATAGLYEIVGTDGAAIDGWCRVSSAEEDGELIFAYGELGNMTPVLIGETVSLDGRLHCLASAEVYAGLDGDDLDIDVTGCLVYVTGGDYNTSAAVLWQSYLENRN